MLFTLFTIGIFFSLFLYHMMIYIGRRNDFRILYYSLFCLLYVISNLTATYFPFFDFYNDYWYQVIQIWFYFFFGITLTLFMDSIFIFAREFKKFVIYFFTLTFFIFLYSVIAGAFEKFSFFLKLPFVICLIYIIIFIYYLISRILIHRKNKTFKENLVLFGFFLFIIFIAYPIALDIMGKTNFAYSHIIFSCLAFIFAYALTGEFNVEYKKLKVLSEDLEQKVKKRISQLEKLNKQKTDFFVNLAHEIKTPLTIILGLFQQYVRDHEPSDDLIIIQNTLNTLKRDIIHYLDFNKLEKGLVRFDHNQVYDINDYIASQVKHFKIIASAKNIDVSFEHTQDDLYIKIDPFAIDHIFNNLLDNAVKYNKPDGKISVTVISTDTSIIVSITDTGIGIGQEKINKIFNPYYQNSTMSSNSQGTGMGLAIVKKIMDSLGTQIDVASRIDEGSCFTMYFKRYFPDKNTIEDLYDNNQNTYIELENIAVPREIEISCKQNAGKNTILIVENNNDLLRFLINALSPIYNVLSAVNGQDALQKMDMLHKPDLIISDIIMDVMDGYAFREELLRMEDCSHIPFIFLTGKSTNEEKIKGLKKGAVDVISKPFDLDELLLKVKSQMHIQNALKKDKLSQIRETINKYIASNQEINSKNIKLSSQEIVVASLLVNGFLYKEIAWKLNVSMNTVQTYIKRIYRKLAIHSVQELITIINQDNNFD